MMETIISKIGLELKKFYNIVDISNNVDYNIVNGIRNVQMEYMVYILGALHVSLVTGCQGWRKPVVFCSPI